MNGEHSSLQGWSLRAIAIEPTLLVQIEFVSFRSDRSHAGRRRAKLLLIGPELVQCADLVSEGRLLEVNSVNLEDVHPERLRCHVELENAGKIQVDAAAHRLVFGKAAAGPCGFGKGHFPSWRGTQTRR